MKKIICVLLVLCMFLSMTGCSEVLGGAFFLFLVAAVDDRAGKNAVFEFVCEKENDLLKAIEAGDFSAFENQGFNQGYQSR